MSTIDIRNMEVSMIDKIVFASEHDDFYNAVSLDLSYGYVDISDADGDSALKITSKEDAENLIKALQKAIELGWWKA